MILSELEVMARLRKAIEEAGSRKAFAEKHPGVHPNHPGHALFGVRPMSPALQRALGVERFVTEHNVVLYREVAPS